jgi:hypothetical protein
MGSTCFLLAPTTLVNLRTTFYSLLGGDNLVITFCLLLGGDNLVTTFCLLLGKHENSLKQVGCWLRYREG